MSSRSARAISKNVDRFVRRRRRPRASNGLTLVSVFSGAGLSDIGYLTAGYNVIVQAELERTRAEIGRSNFKDTAWVIGDVRETSSEIVKTYRASSKDRLSLLVATPPCQGLSSSNPSRGKRASKDAHRHAKKNALLLRIISLARALKPRAVIAENVRQILTHTVSWNGVRRRVVDVLRRELPDYVFWQAAVGMADYGVPQSRVRAVIVAIRAEEKCVEFLRDQQLAPIPAPTHAEGGTNGYTRWRTVTEWCRKMRYPSLDASSEDLANSDDPLHSVPWYTAERYRLIADIPAHSGRSAYENSRCPGCGEEVRSSDDAECSHCQGVLWNRPIVLTNRGARLIKGFESSYRRMRSDRPAATITTNSSHVGSDWKIHPYENRVLSARECADLQTVPRWYTWRVALNGRQKYLIRNLIGEALPPYFTWLHGKLIARLLKTGNANARSLRSST